MFVGFFGWFSPGLKQWPTSYRALRVRTRMFEDLMVATRDAVSVAEFWAAVIVCAVDTIRRLLAYLQYFPFVSVNRETPCIYIRYFEYLMM